MLYHIDVTGSIVVDADSYDEAINKANQTLIADMTEGYVEVAHEEKDEEGKGYAGACIAFYYW